MSGEFTNSLTLTLNEGSLDEQGSADLQIRGF